jgi:hypothetical protein
MSTSDEQLREEVLGEDELAVLMTTSNLFIKVSQEVDTAEELECQAVST